MNEGDVFIQLILNIEIPLWCFLDLDNSNACDKYYDIMLKGEKSSSFNMGEPLKSPAKKSRKDSNREKLPKTSDSTDTLEEKIWKELPEDLYEAVLARLPPATFFRFRSVSHKWNSLLASHSFAQHCAEVPQGHPWFYATNHENVNSGAMYDPSLKKWYYPSNPFSTKMFVVPIASAGGLVCFFEIRYQNFYVCNPLTQSFKRIPSRSVPILSSVAVGMTLHGNGYKIIWLGITGKYEVYDSKEDAWTVSGSMPSSVELPLYLKYTSQSVCIENTMYFMRFNPEGIVSYNVANGVWKQFSVPPPPHLSGHSLAEFGGQIMLVGLLTKNAATCVCIWELQKMTLLWKEVDRMPNVWCLEFYGKHINMTCVGNKSLLMLSLRAKRMNRLVTYDVMKREWCKVPTCVFPSGRKRQWITCGTAFHPSQTALA
ncbi:hypothetical protein GIB67_038832 [Kingdonia uniflora]|uniref:F-box domain-containing protein n=1 Tax=Kingdonia uniflora TaxID=39325 RepID=A0A7J7M0V2_9MAGN|nr:hypothetical protein GIB67_038832 [Kingdonia uniflora]